MGKFVASFLLCVLALPAMASLPTGNYECSQSTVFQF